MTAGGHEGDANSQGQPRSGLMGEGRQASLLQMSEDIAHRLDDLLSAVLVRMQAIQEEHSSVLTDRPGLSQELEMIGSMTRKAAQVAQELEGQAFQQAVAQVGEMTAILAHEVRNPLAAMAQGIQYLTDELSLEGETAQCARLILETSRHTSRLLDDILMMSRPQQNELVPCDLPAILEGLPHYWRAQAADQGVEVRTSYAEHLASPFADPARLGQVFANLISNSLDALPEGGTLWLRVRPAQLVSPLPGQSPCPAVQVEVEDTGVGIPAHEQHRIFEPFLTTKQNRTGLGLSIARRIVQDYRGKIEVRSEERKGTLVTVTLPVR
jgi:signal transduction histidine kinase